LDLGNLHFHGQKVGLYALLGHLSVKANLIQPLCIHMGINSAISVSYERIAHEVLLTSRQSFRYLAGRLYGRVHYGAITF
jgi:hypothetical protein